MGYCMQIVESPNSTLFVFQNYEVGSNLLRGDHEVCLRDLLRFITEQSGAISRVHIMGYADPPGTVGANIELSRRRAFFIYRQFTQRFPSPTFELGWEGRGVRQADGDANSYNGDSRCVRVRVTWDRLENSEQIAITGSAPRRRLPSPPPASPPTLDGNRFYIKLIVIMSMDAIAGGGDYAYFIIRDDNDYWQRYLLMASSAGFSTPSASGPARGSEGWVAFSTGSSATVSDFSGPARITQAGAGLGPSVGATLLSFGNPIVGTRTLNIPSGGTAGAGLSTTPNAALGIPAGAMMVWLDREHSTDWRNSPPPW